MLRRLRGQGVELSVPSTRCAARWRPRGSYGTRFDESWTGSRRPTCRCHAVSRNLDRRRTVSQASLASDRGTSEHEPGKPGFGEGALTSVNEERNEQRRDRPGDGDLADGDYVGYVDQDVDDRQSRGDGSAHQQDPANVADHVRIFLGRTGREQAPTTCAPGSGRLDGLAAVEPAIPTAICGPFLGDYLGLELRRSSLLCFRQRTR